MEQALVEIGVSVRCVEDISEALWGSGVKPRTLSDLNQRFYERIETWRTSEIEGKYPTRSWMGSGSAAAGVRR